MKYIILLVLVLTLSCTKQQLTNYVPVTVDFHKCPGAVAEISFIPENHGGQYIFYGGGDSIQTQYLPDDTYYITFSINSPNCVVQVEYSSGIVDHYDPGHENEKLLSHYIFEDVCP